MARIASLAVLLSTTGNDYLKEEYGKVIANVQKKLISSQIKNTNLSGDVTSGTVEAKRFENRTSNAYGTARSGHAGQKVTAAPVTVKINKDKELITEIENKDISLYGVDAFIEKQAQMDQKSMLRELERDFFSTAKTAGTAVTLTGITDEIDQLEALIQAVETVQNDFVDGVERDMISVTCVPAFFGKIRNYLDRIEKDASGEEVGRIHGVRVYSSVYLPSGVTKGIAMCDGSIAQPVLPTVKPAERIPLSNAVATGLFYSYGTEAVMADLIMYA